MTEITEAHSERHLRCASELFREYADSLGFDLCFQDFADELADLPGEYAPPDGRLLLAFDDGRLAGCVALRRVNDDSCEMKRLYVRPAHRGKRIGWDLATKIIKLARQIGYQHMLLDTVPAMTTAIALYESLGFKDIPPYRPNPIEGARFLRLAL